MFVAYQLPSAMPFNQKPFKEALKILVCQKCRTCPIQYYETSVIYKRSLKATLKCTVTWTGKILPASGVAKKVSVPFFAHYQATRPYLCFTKRNFPNVYTGGLGKGV